MTHPFKLEVRAGLRRGRGLREVPLQEPARVAGRRRPRRELLGAAYEIGHLRPEREPPSLTPLRQPTNPPTLSSSQFFKFRKQLLWTFLKKICKLLQRTLTSGNYCRFRAIPARGSVWKEWYENGKQNSDKIPTKIHQNLSRNHWKEFKNDVFLQNFAAKCEKVSRKFSEILRSERCKSM